MPNVTFPTGNTTRVAKKVAKTALKEGLNEEGVGGTNVSSQLKSLPFISSQLDFRPFVSRQLKDSYRLTRRVNYYFPTLLLAEKTHKA